jgi:hypothetical protein
MNGQIILMIKLENTLTIMILLMQKLKLFQTGLLKLKELIEKLS